MRFCLKVTALGWRFEVQSNAGPSRSPSSPPSRSTVPSPIPSASGTSRNNRSTMADRETPAPSALSLSPSEKTVKKPRNYLALGVALVRAWQFGSSVFVYVSMVSLFVYIRHTRNFNAPLEYVHESGLVSLVYSTVVLISVFAFRRWKKLPGWPVFAWTTFAGDLMIMGLAVTKITLLSQAGVPRDCRGLMPPDKSNFAHANALLTQNTGSSSDGFVDTELSYVDFCLLPRTVYGFCVATIFSHTLSILLTPGNATTKTDPTSGPPSTAASTIHPTEPSPPFSSKAIHSVVCGILNGHRTPVLSLVALAVQFVGLYT
ncbi:hypothetical protein GQ53DRAFT_829609 [Thozetella sp. PMI_491]|nr:hypothetical protein GQ53DRAFT_829609 [Thozetella sp. PMI_491]